MTDLLFGSKEDRIIVFWRTLTAFLLGIVVTLLGAWATHSVSKEDLKAALDSQDRVHSAQMAIIDNHLNNIESQIGIINQINRTAVHDAKR